MTQVRIQNENAKQRATAVAQTHYGSWRQWTMPLLVGIAAGAVLTLAATVTVHYVIRCSIRHAKENKQDLSIHEHVQEDLGVTGSMSSDITEGVTSGTTVKLWKHGTVIITVPKTLEWIYDVKRNLVVERTFDNNTNSYGRCYARVLKSSFEEESEFLRNNDDSSYVTTYDVVPANLISAEVSHMCQNRPVFWMDGMMETGHRVQKRSSDECTEISRRCLKIAVCQMCGICKNCPKKKHFKETTCPRGKIPRDFP